MQALEKNIARLTGAYQSWQIWADWIYMYAVSISQALDFREDREQKFNAVSAKYTEDEMNIFAELTAGFTEELGRDPEQDLLGDTYMRLNLYDHWKGQFFTPYTVCNFMAELTCDDAVEQVREKGYITISDPTCGGGATIIAAYHAVRKTLEKEGLNAQNHVLAVAQDISEITALMCYIQLSMLGIAAVVKVGDTLCDPFRGDPLFLPNDSSLWFTPMYNFPVWAERRVCHSIDLILSKSRRR